MIYARCRLIGTQQIGEVELMEGGRGRAQCTGCTKPMKFVPRLWEEIVALACSDPCLQGPAYWKRDGLTVLYPNTPPEKNLQNPVQMGDPVR